MLNKLLPDQVAAYWDSIKHGIEQSCPADTVLTKEGLNRYLIALMSGTLQAWMCTDRTAEGSVYYGNLVTKLQIDDITGSRSLLLVSLYMFQSAPDAIWEDAYNSLGQYAVANGCKKVIAYTKNPAVLQRGKQFGFDIDWMVLAKDI
jgi:hypothetical protein